MDKYQNKFRILSTRLQGYDYGANGLYYVTICTKNKVHYFGEIVDPLETDNPSFSIETDNHPRSPETDNHLSLQKTIMGNIAIEYWKRIPEHYPFVELDEFIVMPNHLHGILFLNKPDKLDWQPNIFGKQSRNLGSVIRAYKASVKRFSNEANIEFEWQMSFHDRIIRDERELNNIRNYIVNNPFHWEKDELYL